MAKKKSSRNRPPPMPRPLLAGLRKADRLTEQKALEEAIDVLEKLSARYPRHSEPLANLVNLYIDTENMQGYLAAYRRFVKIEPNNADATLGLAGGYLKNMRFATAAQTFRTFLRRWPNHERASDARETLAMLEEKLPEMLQEHNFTGEEGFQDALIHENAQILMAENKYAQAQKAVQQLIKKRPQFASAYNNLSLAQWSEGHVAQAIATAEKVLTFEPDNVHALSNLIRFFISRGKPDPARVYAERLKNSEAQATDKWLKIAEGLSYIGDDEGVLDAIAQAKENEDFNPAYSNPMLYHLAADAALRQGSEKQARKYWRAALQINPGFSIANKCLADLSRPHHERHIPWLLPLHYWLPPTVIQQLIQTMDKATNSKRTKRSQPITQRVLGKYPELIALAPTLLARGDESARELILLLARYAETPELYEAVKDFALGQNGPDQMRLEASQLLSEAGVLTSGTTSKMWIRGEWQEIMQLGWEITDEPQKKHPPHIQKLAEQSTEALYEEDGELAEKLIRQALDAAPDAPDLLNNLAFAHQLQGRMDKAEALILEIHEKHPDYFFGRVNVANKATKEGDLERAKDLLAPLMSQQEMHTSEFTALAQAQIELLLAENQEDGARSWLQMWEDIDPDHPHILRYKFRLNKPKLSNLSRRFFGKK